MWKNEIDHSVTECHVQRQELHNRLCSQLNDHAEERLSHGSSETAIIALECCMQRIVASPFAQLLGLEMQYARSISLGKCEVDQGLRH